jgi:hypothetical protein
MPTNNDEIERLKRLREQQIATRYDPNEKKAKFDQTAAGHQSHGAQCPEGHS